MKVQQYGDRKVGIRPMQYADAPDPVDTNQGLLRGMGSLVGPAAEIDKSKNAALAEETLQEYIRAKNAILMTGENPYYGTEGKDAVMGAEDTLKSIEKLGNDYMNKVGDPETRRWLNRSINQHYTNASHGIASHRMKGQKTWDQSLAGVSIEQAQEQIVQYGTTDPLKVSAAKANIGIQLRRSNPGMSEDWYVEEQQNRVSKALEGSINHAIERGQLGVARGMLERYGDDLEIGEKNAIKEKFTTANQDAQARALADRIFAENESYADQVAAAGSIKDTEVYDKVMSRINQNFSRKRVVEDQAFGEGTEILVSTGDMGLLQQSPAWQAMGPMNRAQLMEKYNKATAARTEALEKGVESTSSAARHGAMSALENGEATTEADLLPYLAQMKESDQNAVRKEIRERGKVSMKAVEDAYARVLGIKAADADQDDLMAFYDYVSKQVRESKNNTDASLRKWARAWVKEGYIKADRFLPGYAGSTLGEAVRAGDTAQWYPETEDDDREKIQIVRSMLGQPISEEGVDQFNRDYYYGAVEALKRKGLPPTPDRIKLEVLDSMYQGAFKKLVSDARSGRTEAEKTQTLKDYRQAFNRALAATEQAGEPVNMANLYDHLERELLP